MTDYYLKAESEAALYAALEAAGIVTREDDGVWTAPGYALDIIGTIHRETGEMNADGYPIMAALPGFHANLRGELTAEQEAALPLIPQPANPVRVWA